MQFAYQQVKEPFATTLRETPSLKLGGAEMTPKTRTAVMIAGFALLAVLAVAGWTRHPNAIPVAANNFASPSGVYTSASPIEVNRPAYGQQQPYNQPAYGNAPMPAGYAPVNCAEPVYTNAAYAPDGDSYSRYHTYNRPRVVRANYVERDRVVDRDVVVRRRGRSTGKSVAIVAGSAGVGAAIGALAGGGKGAGIGALSGGAAGFLYDRLTHNR